MKALILFSLAASLICVGCGSEDSGPESCDLTESIRVNFTRVELVEKFSSTLCPVVSAEQLNSELGDAGADICEVSVDGCSLTVDCDFDIAQGGGTLNKTEGTKKDEGSTFTGFLEVRDPIDCSYSVTARSR